MQLIPTNPDFHFLIFAPGLESWVFSAARRYWATFRPILYSMRMPEDVELVAYTVGGSREIAVTLAMRRDTAPAVRAAVSERLPTVYLDPLVYDTATDLQLTLNGRAELNQRFGVPPETAPQPTRTPGPIQLP
jgi:hypothetical protein